MELFDIIRARRSIRRYQPRPLPEDTLARILEAGSYAPSGGNNQCCHFLVITDPVVIARLRRTAAAAFAEMEVTPDTYKSLANSIRQAKEKGEAYDFTYDAPALVLVANRRGYGNAMADSALAAGNMFLQATALGIGSCYVNQIHWLTDDARMLDELHALGMEQDEFVCAGAVFGYSDMGELPPLKRFGNRITRIP